MLLQSSLPSIDLPNIDFLPIDKRLEFVVEGYFRYYDRDMTVPNGEGGLVTGNQVASWKSYLASRKEGRNEFGEDKSLSKSGIASQAETRSTLTFPSFYDPLTDGNEPLLPLIQKEYRKDGIKFPQTSTAQGDRAVLSFHAKYKDLFGVADKL